MAFEHKRKSVVFLLTSRICNYYQDNTHRATIKSTDIFIFLPIIPKCNYFNNRFKFLKFCSALFYRYSSSSPLQIFLALPFFSAFTSVKALLYMKSALPSTLFRIKCITQNANSLKSNRIGKNWCARNRKIPLNLMESFIFLLSYKLKTKTNLQNIPQT